MVALLYFLGTRVAFLFLEKEDTGVVRFKKSGFFIFWVFLRNKPSSGGAVLWNKRRALLRILQQPSSFSGVLLKHTVFSERQPFWAKEEEPLFHLKKKQKKRSSSFLKNPNKTQGFFSSRRARCGFRKETLRKYQNNITPEQHNTTTCLTTKKINKFLLRHKNRAFVFCSKCETIIKSLYWMIKRTKWLSQNWYLLQIHRLFNIYMITNGFIIWLISIYSNETPIK